MEPVLILVKVEAVAKAVVFYRCSIIQGVISLSVVRSCGLSSCVCDCTKLHHRQQKDHQFLLQHHGVKDVFSGQLSSSEEGNIVFKEKKLVEVSQLCFSAWLCRCCIREDGRVHTVLLSLCPIRVGFVSSHFIWIQTLMNAGEQWDLLTPRYQR